MPDLIDALAILLAVAVVSWLLIRSAGATWGRVPYEMSDGIQRRAEQQDREWLEREARRGWNWQDWSRAEMFTEE